MALSLNGPGKIYALQQPQTWKYVKRKKCENILSDVLPHSPRALQVQQECL